MKLNIPTLIITGYLLGSIPFGYLVGRFWKKVDVRKYGSGNIGATNVLRTLGPLPALVVLLGDVSKGAVAAALGQASGEIGALAAGLAAVAGHNWSIFLKFKGGRGVATAAGMLFALAPGVISLVALIWAIVIAVTRYVSLGSIIAALLAPWLMMFLQDSLIYTVLTFAAALFVIFRHRANMKRLLSGTEYKIGQKISAGEGDKK